MGRVLFHSANARAAVVAALSDLVAFLRARLDEDERYASYGGPTNSWAPRVRADVEAKRRMLDLWDRQDEAHECADQDTLRGLMALPYASHPDFDPTWIPPEAVS